MKKSIKQLIAVLLIILAFGNHLIGSFFIEKYSSLEQTIRVINSIDATSNYFTGDSRNCGPIEIGPTVNTCSGTAGTIGGQVFEDINYNGELAPSIENGISGIIVNLFNEDEELIETKLTDAFGNYLFNNIPTAFYRLEFNIPNNICWAKPSVANQTGNSMVQIVTPGNCYQLGLADPSSFCGDYPNLATTCFIDGEPSLGGTSGEGDVLVAYPYDNPTSGDIDQIALNKDIGTAWGLAYDKQTQDFFVGAMLKRHAGFGPLGTSGIYKINYSNPSNPVIDNWLKLADLGIDVGTDPRNYDLPATAGESNTDPAAFAEVGKIGFGDVDLSADGKTLYAMNLNNNGSLVIIDVPSKSLIAEIPINNPGCGADTDVRPWAIEIHEREVYIGAVCSGQSGGLTDFNFFVLKLNNNNFDEIFSASLDYTKGFIYPRYNNENPSEADICGKWEAWTDDFDDLHGIGINLAGQRICRPQPILSDIEFDKDGSMILAFMDRTGHQTGYNQYNLTDETSLFNGYVGGDVLRVNNNSGTFELEDKGTTSNGGGCGLNGEGPGGGEYYCGDNFKTLHLENSLGALAITPSDELVALNLMDPVGVFSGGTVWLNNQTGQQESAFELYNSHPATGTPEIGTFGKAAGLGDLELVCEPAPLEIGNLVWEDLNGDGLQNADEKGLDGIEVALIKNNVEIATTITANGGQYYFSNSEAANQSWIKSGEKVLSNMTYTLRIKSNLFPFKVKTKKTPLDEANLSFLRDNDAELIDDNIDINLLTADNGCIDHNYDFGIIPTLCLGNLVWEDVNNDGLFNNGEQGIPDVSVTLCSVGNDGRKGTADDLIIDQMLTDSEGKYLFNCLFEGDYFVKIEVDDGISMHSSTGRGFDGAQPLNYEPAVDPDNDLDSNDDGSQMGQNFIMSEVITLTLDGEPSNDADFNTYTNTSVDFGLFKLLSIGNKVWTDKNNNGLLDANERGINGVEVALFQPGPDGIKATEDDVLVEQMITDLNGCYDFDDLHPGQYWVKLVGGIPMGTTSSDGLGMAYDGTGLYESGIDPNIVEVDSDDNGQQMGTMIMSELVDLFINQEPINDIDQENHTNTTIDFALFPQHQIRLYAPCNCLGNASSPTANDGQFSDKIVILSTTSGEKWTLKSGTGLYSMASPAPPASPISIPIGTMLMEDGLENGFFRYVLELRHVDGQGYSACFTNGTTTLTADNLCKVDASCIKNIVTSPDATPVAILDPCVQNFILGKDGVLRTDTLKCCDDKSTFSDDGTTDGLYIDTAPRTDVYTICSPDKWKTLKYNVNDFDVATGDTLYVYDGASNSAPLIGKYSGTGISQTGGWFSGNCDPYINPTGCITFEFKTNGDNNKGRGWAGNFECSDRNIILAAPNNLNANLDCASTKHTFTFNPAVVTADCGTVLDTQYVRIFDAKGKLCRDTCIGGTESFQEIFGVGSYLVQYKLKADTVKTTEVIATVQEASLVCNDKVTIPLGSGCTVALTPDDLLESFCDTITDTVYYHITLEYTDQDGKIKTITSGGKGGEYPLITKDMLGACGGTLNATIERRYYEGLNLPFCNNGMVSQECSVEVNIVDQSVPWISAISTIDTFVTCNIDLSEEGLGLTKPTAFDNCTEATVTFVAANIISLGSEVCDTSRVEVTWEAADACGNTSTAIQTVVFIRPRLEDIEKTGTVQLACGSDTPFSKVPSIKVGKLKNGQLEATDTIELSTKEYVCGYILQKREVDIPATDCGRKVYQYWSVLDWCDGSAGPQPIDTTLIEYLDMIAPKFSANSATSSILELDHFSCTYDITTLSKPSATDNCSEPTVRLAKVSRIANGVEWEIATTDWSALDCDSFKLQWIAEDDCHQQLVNDTLEQIVEIKDVTGPSALCNDKINLSISENYASLHYSDIDAGSFDACGIQTIELSRDEVQWDSTVIFGCEDIHQNIMVSLRITDKKGNQSICWASVNVEDKIVPVCNDLEDIIVDCDKFHNGDLGPATDTNDNKQFDDAEWVPMTEAQEDFFNMHFGNPDCFDNATCEQLVFEQEYQLIEKGCGLFQAKRRYRARDWNGEGRASNWAEQKINAEQKENWSITLPADWVGECGTTIPSSDVLLQNGSCDLMAYEVEEKTFTVVEDACLKVVRKFTFINWCVYKSGQAAVAISRNENEHGMVNQETIITSKEVENVGKLEYTQILKLQDDTAPSINIGQVDNCIDSEDCMTSKRFAISATDCNLAAIKNLDYSWVISSNNTELAKGEGSYFEYNVLPKIKYQVKWMVSDNCGNTAWEEEDYEFWDCKKPSPYCLHGLAVELMPDVGMIQVWAKDLERNSSDNCTPKDKLDFRIWHGVLGSQPTTLQAVQTLPEVINLNCAYLGNQKVHLYVIDEEGNWDFCETYVDVQDNMAACQNIVSPDGMATLSGMIRTWKQHPVQQVMVQSSTTSNTTEYMTKEDGHYGFELEMENDYIIRPEKDIQPLAGVSTFDLVLISKHILGITPFDNPYQMIAADVNNSGTITTFDMVQIRQLILNSNQTFANSTSWKFVPADYEFTTDNPITENYPNFKAIADLNINMEMDFVAIKIGDVNGNVSTSLVTTESRSNKVFEIETEDKDLVAGKTYNLVFTTKQIANIQGYQFTLGFDNIKLEKLQDGLANTNNFGLHKMEKGIITTSWNQQQFTKTEENMQELVELFTIEFTALQDGKLSEQISLSNQPTPIEAYGNNGELIDIKLLFFTPKESFEVFQNSPNPFNKETNIGFNLPDDSEVQLLLRDEMGRVIKSIKGEYKKGYNTIQLNDEELKNGLFYYQVSSKFGSITKKMLVLN